MNPPEGSKVKIELERGYEQIVMPHGSGGALRFFIAAFLIAWLGGWASGWVTAFRSLLQSQGANAFLLFWLCGWTVGGAFAGFFLIRLLRSSVPEVLTLNLPSLTHDSGVPPFVVSLDRQSHKDVWQKLFKRRRKTEFAPQDLQTLRLREVEGGNRLTIDKGSERIEIGTALGEIEREWLHATLISKYRLLERGANE